MMDSSGSTSADPRTNTIRWEILYLYPRDILSTDALPATLFDLFLVLLFIPSAALFTHGKHLVLMKAGWRQTIINNYVNYTLYLDKTQIIITFI